MTISKLLAAALVLINTQQVYSERPQLGLSFYSGRCREFSITDGFKKECTIADKFKDEPTDHCKDLALIRIQKIVGKIFPVDKTDMNKRLRVVKELTWLEILTIASTFFEGSSLGTNEKGETMVMTYRAMLLYYMRNTIPVIWRGIKVHNTEKSRFTHLFALHLIWQCITFKL